MQPSSWKQATHGPVPLPILLSQLGEHTIGLDLAIREIGPSRAALKSLEQKSEKKPFMPCVKAPETMHKLRAGPAEHWTPAMSSTLDQGIVNVWINIFILRLNNLSLHPVIRLCRPNLPKHSLGE